jgi:hypothetical protein
VRLADLPEAERLKLEHEAMASTLAEAENYVPEETMKTLRRHFAMTMLAALEARS